jgi:transposase
MSTQQALPLPLPVASNTVVINARCSLRIEADQRVVVVAGLPMHHYRSEDAVAAAYAMVFLVESGFAQQTEVARAFARSQRSLRRYQKRYAQGGMAALSREAGWRRGRRRVSGKRLRSIEMLKSQGLSNRAIAHRLGVSEKAVRKLFGASADNTQLTLAGIGTTFSAFWIMINNSWMQVPIGYAFENGVFAPKDWAKTFSAPWSGCAFRICFSRLL